MKCTSVRKKGSLDPCPILALRGHSLCGRHARAKVPTLWAHAVRAQAPPIVKLQALVRGWLVRLRLRLAGPGVLSRKNLANDEELVTCESKDREHPMTYFEFEENGKVWWFKFESIWRWSTQNSEPANPYTKVPLSASTKKRLRAIWAWQQRHHIRMPEEPTEYAQRLRTRWNTLTQVFADNGFIDVNPAGFVEFTSSELRTMFVFLERDVQVVLPDSNPGKHIALRICQRGIHASPRVSESLYVLWSAHVLLRLLSIHKDPYSMTFLVLSALYRC